MCHPWVASAPMPDARVMTVRELGDSCIMSAATVTFAGPAVRLAIAYSGENLKISPHLRRPPALPVAREPLLPPRPRSSSSAWTTNERAIGTSVSNRSAYRSLAMVTLKTATPFSSASMLPKSPRCLLVSALSGAPWVVVLGFQWPPVEAQPSEKSAELWMWNPCRPGLSPVTTPVQGGCKVESRHVEVDATICPVHTCGVASDLHGEGG
mmetsp:Transcript_42835/g.109592  ORF Transcript_42835/g.109592 Transcript_42835/m.109592 type:complete len:210 (-) Transcript_42835:291-920(-)